jgi:hypothetical protein
MQRIVTALLVFSPFFLLVGGTTSSAQPAPVNQAGGQSATVAEVQTPEPPSECKHKERCTEFWHTIYVKTRNLDSYLANKKVGSRDAQRGDLVLFLDDRPLKEIKASQVSRSGNEDQFRFELEPRPEDDSQRAAWVHIIHRADKNAIAVSVGLAESEPIPSDQILLSLVVEPWWRWFVWLGIVLLGLLILWLAWKKEFLSDPEKVEGLRQPLSLARCQMAWWFYLIVCAWGYTAAILRSPLTITNTALILSGISAATGLSSLTIDKSQRAQGSKVTKNSKFWLYDLVSDGQGVSVPRFQMVVWTIVLGVYFASYVWNKMIVPELDNNLLILMGISSGTYVTMKIPEAAKTAQSD